MTAQKRRELMARARKQMQGFTIIELLIVVIVIGVLAAAGIAKYQDFAEKARTRTCTSNQSQIDNALSAYFTQYRSLPLTSSGYMRFQPMTGIGEVRGEGYGTNPATPTPAAGHCYGRPPGTGAASQLPFIAQVMGDTKGFFCPGSLSAYYQGDRARVTTPAAYWGAINGMGTYQHSYHGAQCTVNSPAMALAGGTAFQFPVGHSFVYCHDFGRVGQAGPDGSPLSRHSARW